jgi:hypothetical protein
MPTSTLLPRVRLILPVRLPARRIVVERRLWPLNALVGLVTPGDVNPAALADVGFRLAGLEVPVLGADGAVKVDAILFQDASVHLVLAETKSGANVEPDQARRYAALDASAVVQAGHVTLPRRVAPTAEVLYMCLGEHVSRIRQGLQAAGVTFPVMAVHDNKITLEAVDGISDQMRSAFSQGPVALLGPPIRIITFDHDSPVEVLEPFVKAELVVALTHRVPYVTISGLTERTTPYFGLYGRAARNRLTRQVDEAARRIAKADSGTFAYEAGTANREAMVRVLRTPEDNDTRGRTQAYQALARTGDTRRRRRRVSDPNQLDLFQELDEADDGDEDDTPDGDEEARP